MKRRIGLFVPSNLSSTPPPPNSYPQISFSADHRVLDGVTVAKFSNEMKRYIESPMLMLSQLR